MWRGRGLGDGHRRVPRDGWGRGRETQNGVSGRAGTGPRVTVVGDSRLQGGWGRPTLVSTGAVPYLLGGQCSRVPSWLPRVTVTCDKNSEVRQRQKSFTWVIEVSSRRGTRVPRCPLVPVHLPGTNFNFP